MTIMKKWYGIKKPDIENKISILKYSKKKGIDTTDIVAINVDAYTSKLNGIPDIDIFDKNGKYIEYRQTDSSCNAGLFSFIPELKPDGIYKLSEKTDLGTELKKIRTLTGESYIIKDKSNYDFFLIIYWAVFTGRLNKNHVLVWEQEASNNKNAKIKVIKVNVDIQECWGKAGTDLLESVNKKIKTKN